MNILVTGGNGQLGCCMQKLASENPNHKFVFTDMPEADITDEKCIENFIVSNNTDIIVNCAAYTAVDKAETDVELCAKINAYGPKVLSLLAKKFDIPLIHVSTDYVFSGITCTPLHEYDPTGPTGIYGKTKLDGETAICESGCKAAIIRTAWLYSEYGNNFVKTMLRLGKERDKLTVVYDQAGTPTYAVDLANAIIRIAESEIIGCEVYHYSNEGVLSWFDFARKIFQLKNYMTKVEAVESDRFPTPAKRPAYSVLSKDKIKAKGIEVPYWEDSLKKCLEELTNLNTEKSN
ncbi:MAG: dTDP-4-dehydrorhamnose reductase [Rikenellaceae bacterium]|nr:dTDP-4-dehydrorhamnose reductase [Rikenellaceae bacterium]